MNEKYDSYLELAVALMKKKKKPQSLDDITKEVFEKKGHKGTEEEIAQFQVDFMLSGYFVCCGEDKEGEHIWDFKTRQPSSLLDKDGGYLEDLYEEDEDVIKNELKDDVDVALAIDKTIYIDDDEEDEEDENDDIAEELGLVEVDENNESITSEIASEDDEEKEEVDDIEEELMK